MGLGFLGSHHTLQPQWGAEERGWAPGAGRSEAGLTSVLRVCQKERGREKTGKKRYLLLIHSPGEEGRALRARQRCVCSAPV